MDYIDEIYCSLQGLLTEEAAIPWVQSAFMEGSLCDLQYDRVLAAYSRLCDRLGVADEDKDVEDIMDAFLQIQRTLCREMFICGRKYQQMMK